ncbi:MAG: dynamin family protein [Oleiphilaceae bacterium]|nr:dynamin family protein [Oleiphilaceae bacterium]
MSTPSSLSEQVEAYHQWKKQLVRQVTHYRSWLQHNDLLSQDLSLRLRRGMQLLIEDELTLAFAGEFSRGKTELINGLFFSQYGQRMLPSEAGRTTMCPTELFFDRKSRNSYLKLLPIESRLETRSLAQLRTQSEAWTYLTLDPEDTAATSEALSQVARVKSVHRDEARHLGFSEDRLDDDPAYSDHVFVPVWRHALISFQHPLLERGLRILDTPGLNALGSEPELTISMLPSAQAVIFLLSADAGVTASDMSIWKEHIDTPDADHRAGRFAVLNKIDTLWDDLQGEKHSEEAIARICAQTARQLGLESHEVIPVSAKQGLVGKVRQDPLLLERSQMPRLESLIIERILTQKEKLITHNLVGDLMNMLYNSQSALQARLDAMDQEYQTLGEKQVEKEAIRRLAEKVQKDFDYYNRKLITLRSSRRLVQSQGTILANALSDESFEEHVHETRQKLSASWTTLGMNRAMDRFFQRLENDFSHLMTEGRLAEKMVQSLYQRYNDDGRGEHLKPIPLRAGRHLHALRDLRSRTERFRRNPSSLLSNQSLLIQRFMNTIVSEARLIHQRAREDIQRWPQETLLPIMHYSGEQKRLLEHQVRRLRKVTQSEKTLRQEQQKLERDMQQLRGELSVAEKLQREIRQPPPSLSQRKVVSLSGIA